MGLNFFGVQPENKGDVLEEIFLLAFYGRGGFTWDQVYNMPVYIRKNNIKLIKEYVEKEKNEANKNKQSNETKNKLHKPNIRKK